ncbi:MAG: purine-nucleoside phosphorylase [Chloroflexota bacterium]
MMSNAGMVGEASDFVLTHSKQRPSVGLILGSGLGGLADEIREPEAIPYAVIPNFPQPTVEGHQGELIVGQLGQRVVAALRGRVHLYEGYAPAEIAFPVRLLRALGCHTLVVTNAAGGLAPDLDAGDLMLIGDHIFLPGMLGASPLIGLAEPKLGPRFVDMSHAYDARLRELAHAVAEERGISLKEGTYVMVAGPTYETPAELRFLRSLGADAVGMSTCPEVVAARQSGMRVLGVSVITNKALGDAHTKVSHVQVLNTAESAGESLVNLVGGVIQKLEL